MMKKNSILSSLVVLVLTSLLTACNSSVVRSMERYATCSDNFVVAMNPQRDYLTVVNNDHPYDFYGGYSSNLQNDIVYAADILGRPTPIEKATYLALTQLILEMKYKGIDLGLYSAFRTKVEQVWVYKKYGDLSASEAERSRVHKPGYSEHHTGLLVNVAIFTTSGSNAGMWCTEVADHQAEIPELEVLRETLADHGFIERYPAGKEEITDTPYEPYEIRFVGSSQIAHEIMDNNLCLEEYLARLDDD